jgi:hypothetical protein
VTGGAVGAVDKHRTNRRSKWIAHG